MLRFCTTSSSWRKSSSQSYQSANDCQPTHCSAHTTIYSPELALTRIMIIDMLESCSRLEDKGVRQPCTRSSRRCLLGWALKLNSTRRTKKTVRNTVSRKTRPLRSRALQPAKDSPQLTTGMSTGSRGATLKARHGTLESISNRNQRHGATRFRPSERTILESSLRRISSRGVSKFSLRSRIITPNRLLQRSRIRTTTLEPG